MPAAPFRRPLLYFRLYLSFSEFRHGFICKGVPSAVGDYDVIQQGQFSEKCLECLDRALERNGGTLEEDSSPYGILDRDGSILYGSRELLERVRVIHPRLHLFGHIHKSYGTTSDGVTVFCNAAIMEEGYDNLNAQNVLSLTVLEN